MATPKSNPKLFFAAGLIILLWLIPLASSRAAGLPDKLSFEHYSLDEGLSQSIVFAIHQDRRGFLWIATESGLNRYDGYEFTVFKNLPFDSTTISNNNIRAICEDDSGMLWIATTGGGLNRYDWRSEKFTRFRSRPDDSASLSHDIVFALFKDRQNNIWAVTAAGGLDRYDAARNRFVHYRHGPGDQGLDHDAIFTVHIGGQDGRIWVGTAAGLNLYDPARDEFTRYKPAPGMPAWRGVREITETRSEPGLLWLATGNPGRPDQSLGLFLLDPASGRITRYHHRPDDPYSLPTDQITNALEDQAGRLWLASDRGLLLLDRLSGRCRSFLPQPGDPSAAVNNIQGLALNRTGLVIMTNAVADGLWAFDPVSERFAHYHHDPADPFSLSNDNIISAWEDSTGVLWLGSNTGGLNKLEYDAHKFQRYGSEPGNDNSLAFPLVRAIYEDHAGYLWVGTSRGGLHRYTPDRQSVRHYRFSARDPFSLGNDNVWALGEDHTGALWVGTYGGGLSRLDPQRERFERFTADSRDTTRLTDDRIRVIFADSQHRLWIGTESGGLLRYDFARHAFIRVIRTPDADGSASVRAIAEDPAGRLWLGTFGGGLECWDPATGARKIYHNDPQDVTTLSSNYLQSLWIDHSGLVWIGTFGGGLNRLDPATESFIHFTEQNSGLPENAVYAVLGDDQGNIWCSSNRGLSCYNPRHKSFQNYDVHHGLQSKEFNGQAGFRSRRGELFFGGINGFNAFFPDRVRNNPYPPRVHITGLKIFGEPVPIAPDSPLPGHIASLPHIELSHRQNDLTFEFVALHFNQPRENRYAYLLENYDSKWRMAGSERSATYTNLSPGSYRFRVIAANSDGVWNKEGSSIALIIHPPWWRTTAASILFGLLFIGAAWAAYRFQHRRVVKREQEKAHIVNAELRAQAAEAQARAVQAENERQSHELEEARRLQLSMLPKRLPQVPNLDIAVFMETATEVGGDFYDFRLAPDGMLTVAIGDATGHGLKAGTMVSVLKGLFIAYGANGKFGDFFQICTRTIRNMHLGNLYMALALVKVKDDTVNISSAGMPPFYHFRRATGEVAEITLKGMPLGAFNDYPYQQAELLLEEGDSLLLLSDGLAEVFNEKDEIFDYPRVKTAFEQIGHLEAEEIIRRLQGVAKKWRNGRELHDDITFVVLKKKSAA